jgi:transcription-repair coupling factor (superfamily II helicase)
LRLKAQQLGIRAIEVGPEGGSIDFKENTRVNPLSLVKLVQSDPQSYRLAGATRLRFDSSLPDGAARQQYLEQLLDNFATDAGEAAA